MTRSSPRLLDGLKFIQDLRYGENPHQKASWYGFSEQGLTNAKLLQGKELSYNNLIDLEAAILTVQEFKNENAAVVIKHTNPCGVAIGSDVINKALDCDRISSFGGIIAYNKIINHTQAKDLIENFYECIVAKGFTQEALEIFSKKSNLRLLEVDVDNMQVSEWNVRSVLGGILLQEKDNNIINYDDWHTVTKLEPTNKEFEDLIFSWKVCKHVHSNAIVLARDGKITGIGAGQMNRIGSAKIAFENNNEHSVLASDGFFPFDDIVRLAKDYGINSIIQPGGSVKDEDSIVACDELKISMIFTNTRHFLH